MNSAEILKMKQALPLDIKIKMTLNRIREFYNQLDGQVYVSFSGGKDSTVLLHLVRSLYPDVEAIFFDTGLEFPEIRQFAKAAGNCHFIRPKMGFKQVIEKYGWPVVSKEVSQKIYEARTTKSAKLLHKRLHGDNNKYKSGKIPNKWQFLIKAPFKISHRCCDYLKKNIGKKIPEKPIIGTMAMDSHARKQKYLRNGGCNSFAGKVESMPMSFWQETDVWDYIRQIDIPYCGIYDMGYERTGCMFCMFGVHLEGTPNRFQRMKETHPKLYDYCINKLGVGKVLDYIGMNYEPEKQAEFDFNLKGQKCT